MFAYIPCLKARGFTLKKRKAKQKTDDSRQRNFREVSQEALLQI